MGPEPFRRVCEQTGPAAPGGGRERDVLEEADPLGLAADHGSLRRERSQGAASFGRGHWSPA
jgi:hypothetical protein